MKAGNVLLGFSKDGMQPEKGETIKRFMEHLNPRAAHVVALEKPTDREKGQWYFQRYIEKLPTKGEMAFFDDLGTSRRR